MTARVLRHPRAADRPRTTARTAPRAATAVAWALALAATALAPPALRGQEEAAGDTVARDTARGVPPAAGAGRSRCDLVFQPTSEETESRSVAIPEGGYVTHVRGGMVWTCGNATMEADSAVRFDAARRVELIGNVDYRDTIRTLQSRRLDYFEIGDRVIATGDVRLTRLASGSTLEAPRVEFLRAVSGVNQLTVATGRPHMTLRAEGEGAAPAPGEGGPPAEGAPFEVDADRAVFAGEEVALASGDVIIERPDLRATADSAYFRVQEGVGLLFGDPVATGESFQLSGDSLRIEFEDRRLREVRAMGEARAAGEEFEVLGERLTIRVRDDRVEAVWAHGEGRSMAVSSRYRLYGDSLRFAMEEGRIDTVVAVGDAAAVEDSTPETARAGLDAAAREGAGAGPVAGDTPVPAGRDTLAVTGEDTLAAGADRGAAADTGAAVGADSAAADSAAGGAPAAGAAAGTRGIPPPRLDVDAEANWVSGDTLYAIFEPVDGPAAPDTAPPGAGPTPPGPPGPGAVADTAAGGGGAADSAGALVGEGERRSRMRQLRVVGDARSFYAAVRDSARTRRASRNYLIGRRIDVHFREGEADRVVGTRAIGLYLDPLDGGGGGAPRAAPPDTAAAPPDTLAAPPDTLAAPPDTSVGPPDTARADPDTVRRGRGVAGAAPRVAIRRRGRRP